MKYMGSKAKYAKSILEIVLADRQPGQVYVEPFVGGGNVIEKVDGPRLGSDSNRKMVALLSAVASGWEPPRVVTIDDYMYAQAHPDELPDHLCAFIAIGASYGGKWFGGYARGNRPDGSARNYADESARNILKQAKGLVGVKFSSGSYDQLEIPSNSIIYCDPPYASTTKYKDSFDSDRFWQWCDLMVDQGHTVFVSEYNAPDHWRCVWEKTVNSSLTKDTGSKKNVERLFTRQAKASASYLVTATDNRGSVVPSASNELDAVRQLHKLYKFLDSEIVSVKRLAA